MTTLLQTCSAQRRPGAASPAAALASRHTVRITTVRETGETPELHYVALVRGDEVITPYGPGTTSVIEAEVAATLHATLLGLDVSCVDVDDYDPWPPGELRRGAVVDYHGSKTDEHGEHYVVGFDPGHADRYVIADRDYPWFRLNLVRRASISPTGEIAELCRCDHEYTYCSRGRQHLCAVTGCGCTSHTAPQREREDT